jgi:AcrR family transcriptional regulator
VRTRSPAQAEKILRVAARLFASHRFHEARMEDIAAAAEVGKGTLYRYFKDKEELYMALLSQGAEGMLERLHDGLAGAVTPCQRLEAVVEAYIEFFDEHPHLFDVIQHAEVMHKSQTEFPWQRTRAENIRLVTDILLEGERAGAFHLVDADLAVLLLLGGVRSVIRFGPRPRPTGLAHAIVESFLHGASRCSVRA